MPRRPARRGPRTFRRVALTLRRPPRPATARQVSLALDRGAREKEAVALLLSEAFPAVVSADQVAKARPPPQPRSALPAATQHARSVSGA